MSLRICINRSFIAYNIGVYESVQKFGSLITSGKITNGTDVSRVAELLSESNAFYDAEMISELMNAMLQEFSWKIFLFYNWNSSTYQSIICPDRMPKIT